MDNGGCCHGGQTTDHCHVYQTVGPGSFWKSKMKTHRQSLLIANVNQGDLHCLTIASAWPDRRKERCSRWTLSRPLSRAMRALAANAMGDSTYLTNPIERVPVVYMVGCSIVMHDEGEIACHRSAILAVEIFV